MTTSAHSALYLSDDQLAAARARGIAGMLAVFFVSTVILLVFRAEPGFDKLPSAYFFQEQTCKAGEPSDKECGLFPLSRDATFNVLRDIGLRVPTIGLVGLALYLLMVRFVSVPSFRLRTGKWDLITPFWGFLSGFIGIVAITNWTLKEHWGRPRPWKSLDFGGDLPYVPPGTLTNYCDTNCSFVSGEAAAAFWFVWFAFLFHGRMRFLVAAILIAFAIAVSALRVGFGGHYVSDVLLAGCVAWFSIALVYWAFHTRPVSNWLQNDSQRL